MTINSKIWVIGDASVDLVPDDAQRYLKCPGGASANVAVCIARLGGQSGFIGRLGQDEVGAFLADTLSHEHVDISHLIADPTLKTAVLLVNLSAEGERSFSYLVTPSADSFVRSEDLPLFAPQDWFYFSSIGLTRDPSRQTCLTGARRMRSVGGSVLFDVNLRESMWQQPDDIRPVIETAISQADICKISADELCRLSGQSLWQQGRYYARDLGCPTTVITLGSDGAYLIHQGQEKQFSAPQVEVVDTTGAGDAFVGGMLTELSVLSAWRKCDLSSAMDTANYCGAAVVTAKGAMTALPSAQQLMTLQANYPLSFLAKTVIQEKH